MAVPRKMKTMLISAALCLIVPLLNGADDQSGELAKLQGDWVVVLTPEIERQGVYDAPHALSIKGDQWIVMNDVGEFKSTIAIDASKSPKTIDQSRNGRKRRGIYKLEGDTLTICFAVDERPADFTVRTDSKSVVTIYKRRKP